MKTNKIKYFSPRKMKKARFKRYMKRAKNRGDVFYWGFVSISDYLEL